MIPLDLNNEPEMTPEFLQLLARAARTYGWEGDYTEVAEFVRWCFGESAMDVPDLEPFEPIEEYEMVPRRSVKYAVTKLRDYAAERLSSPNTIEGVLAARVYKETAEILELLEAERAQEAGQPAGTLSMQTPEEVEAEKHDVW